MFDLTITFAGICLLVRDEANKRLHVLMPPTSGGMVHYPALVFVNSSGAVEQVDIPPGTDIDLTQVSGSNGLKLTMPTGVFDFDGPPYGPRAVKQSLLDPATFPAGVSVRARLAAGECAPLRRPGGVWDIDSGGSVTTHRIATAVDWVIKGVSGTELPVNLGSAGTKVVPLIGTAMHVLIVHVQPGELKNIGEDVPLNTGCPAHGDPLYHLGLYFPLLTPDTVPDLPTFNKPASLAAGVVCPPSPVPGADPDFRAAETEVAEAATGRETNVQACRAAETGAATAGDGADAPSAAADSQNALIQAAARFEAADNSGSELTCTVATVRAG